MVDDVARRRAARPIEQIVGDLRIYAGLRLTATDVEWTVGDGPEVSGPIHALVLLLTGRPAATIGLLSGEGIAELPARLAAPAKR
jgi:hypothetical protein